MSYHLKYRPENKELTSHIDHYWIVKNTGELFKKSRVISAYPGITPELIIPLHGHIDYHYLGKKWLCNKSKLFCHLEGKVKLDTRNLNSFIIVQFKSRALASLQVFTKFSAIELMTNPVLDADLVFGPKINDLTELLRTLDSVEIVARLDEWWYSNMNKSKEGFIAERLNGTIDNSGSILEGSNYSYSSLERHFKKESGMTPKKFQIMKRYKKAVEEIYATLNHDWMYYVEKYGYFDQSHFIREIKRYTSFTPAQLLATPGLISFRPDNIC